MSRLLDLQSALLREIDYWSERVPARDETADWERVHMASSARIAWLLALQRNVDPELAACACAVHDYGRIVTGKQAGHAQAGFIPVQSFLKSTALFTAREIQQIGYAVKNHSSKSEVGTPIEEIVKDADVVDCYQYGLPFQREEQKRRYEAFMNHSGFIGK